MCLPVKKLVPSLPPQPLVTIDQTWGNGWTACGVARSIEWPDRTRCPILPWLSYLNNKLDSVSSFLRLTLWLCFCSTCYLVAARFHPNRNCTAGLRRRKSWWGRERAHVCMCDRNDAFSPSASPFCLLLIQVLGAKTEVTVGEWRNWKFWNTPEEVQADKSFFASSHKRDGHCLLDFFYIFLAFFVLFFYISLHELQWCTVLDQKEKEC